MNSALVDYLQSCNRQWSLPLLRKVMPARILVSYTAVLLTVLYSHRFIPNIILLSNKHPRLAFVDLETTGGTATADRITEVGIIEVDEHGAREWSSLVNPEMRIPPFIQSLTGISDAMVQNAPTFAELADEIQTRLADRIFIAHNARFDHGFLKNAFQRTGHIFRPSVLCTVRLSRKLFPEFTRHNLDSIVARHQLHVNARHRALGDAQLLWQFWKFIHEMHAPELIDEIVSKLISRPSPPSRLDALQISQQIARIDCVETAGELGALLQEAALIKKLRPAYNQQLRTSEEVCAWRLINKNGKLQPVLATTDDLFFGHDPQLYGLFISKCKAKEALKAIADAHALCHAVLGLEKVRAGTACFASKIGKCQGACAGKETIASHNERLAAALQQEHVQPWPYDCAIGIRESNAVHVIDCWAYLGTAASLEEASIMCQKGQQRFDRDVYIILQKWLPTLDKQIVKL